jgi:hypothetical protein
VQGADFAEPDFVPSDLAGVGDHFAAAIKGAFLGEGFGFIVHRIAQRAAVGNALAEPAPIAHDQKDQVFAGPTGHDPALQFYRLTHPLGQVSYRLRFHKMPQI